jgi:hypothetical protein
LTNGILHLYTIGELSGEALIGVADFSRQGLDALRAAPTTGMHASDDTSPMTPPAMLLLEELI